MQIYLKNSKNVQDKRNHFCGIKQFQTEDDERYIVLLFKSHEFEGELVM